MKAQIFILCLAISTAMSNFVIPRRNVSVFFFIIILSEWDKIEL